MNYKNEKIRKSIFDLRIFGGDDRDRTDYLLNAIQALSQVSYTPTVITILTLQQSEVL